MPKIYPNLQEIARYEESPNINQSGLKEIEDKGIQQFLISKNYPKKTDKYFEDAEHFLVGHACDNKMCFPPEHYNSLYHYSELTKLPSDTMRNVLHMVLALLQGYDQIGHLVNYGEFIHEALNVVPMKDKKGEVKLGYYMDRAKPDWRIDTRVDGVLNDQVCKDYWIDIVRARGKEVLDSKQNLLITQITDNWLCHPNTKDLFTERPDVFRLYQVPVYFEVDGIGCKGLVDKVDIYPELELIKPYDFKTMRGHTLTFPKTLQKRRYDLQGSFYRRGLSCSLQSLTNLTGLNIHRGYQVDYMTFIVESTTNPGTPYQFQLTQELDLIGESGTEDIKGYEQMLYDYSYWLQRDFQLPQGEVLTIDSQFKMIYP
jgi:hypothetical protein